MADADEWIFDFLMEYLRSPLWTTPISSFVDRNCLVFDNEEENKLVYTEIHNDYKKLIDDLLESFLQELQLPHSQFMKACSQAMTRSYARSLVEEFIAADDFLAFKTLMVKRNMELELEALKVLQGLQAPEKQLEKEPEDEEERMLQEAIRLSQLEMQKGGDEIDEQLKRVIALSLEEAQVEEKKRKQELASLDHAISLSKALEAEKKEVDKSAETAKAVEQRIAKANQQTNPKLPSAEDFVRPTALKPLTRVPSTPSATQATSSSAAKPSEDELRQRADYLRQQRDRILQVRETKRQEVLQQYEKPQPINPPPTIESAASTAAAKEVSDEQVLEARRALTRRLKQELIGSSSTNPSELVKQLDQEKEALSKSGRA
eukprot:TRINITY_DN5677_c0_g1_i1.p1 TRINITY_DN5677_c0_g1~~TRINITY_DN5677_c0_g1_i1.p1  ORF type:complete len:376 (-),score=122.53 TRINITY_DN5677_c0_g1_i1:282-1409(-)